MKTTQKSEFSFIILGIFCTDEGFLMERTERNKLQLPGRKFQLSQSVNEGQTQYIQEKSAVTNLFNQKTGYFFWISAIAGMYNFTEKGRLIKVFLLRLSDQYTTAFKIPNNVKNLIFIPADAESIKKNRKILPDDKKILLDFLINKDSIIESHEPRNMTNIKAIAS
jgi:hypothetical protein